jgi:hypothetical protein
VTGAIEPNAGSSALIEPFPVPGRLVQLAYRELDLESNGAQDQVLTLRDLRDLPRPWDHCVRGRYDRPRTGCFGCERTPSPARVAPLAGTAPARPARRARTT